LGLNASGTRSAKASATSGSAISATQSSAVLFNGAQQKPWNITALFGRCGIGATVPEKKMLALPVTVLPQK
jgi:hypothetical protein